MLGRVDSLTPSRVMIAYNAFSQSLEAFSIKAPNSAWTSAHINMTEEPVQTSERQTVADGLASSDAAGNAFRADRSIAAALYAYSLITRAGTEHGAGSGLIVHRLVQDFAHRAMSEERRAQALREALEWVNAAFVGDPQDVRSWPVRMRSRSRDAQTRRRWPSRPRCWGLLFRTKARFAEAEPLHRRALAIDEASLGPEHPDVATGLNNLALLFNDTNRLAEAEPLLSSGAGNRRKELWPGPSQCGS